MGDAQAKKKAIHRMIDEHDLDQLEGLAKMGIAHEGLRPSPVEISNKAALEIVHTIRHLREYKVRIDDALSAAYRDMSCPHVAKDIIKAIWEVSEPDA